MVAGGPISLLLKSWQTPAQGRYQEIAQTGGHLLNTEKPYELAQAIKGVCCWVLK